MSDIAADTFHAEDDFARGLVGLSQREKSREPVSRAMYGEHIEDHATKNAAILIAGFLVLMICIVCVFWIWVHSSGVPAENTSFDQLDKAVERVLAVLSGFLTFIFGFLFNQKLEAKARRK
ncbi:hypothetical protein PsAD2_04447 [Pseudovibrio axinellae]|uniref:Uncharacterized protein n=1 Tax=Pseudovibrio axinellae TaxID=989403 RepID=A0A165SZM5_9HYPH|nr:hypothetical protein [Pseudovibrio axinellae]KZL05092.1 hypothetical protein PsAD2_04447 [Pseudovibrio axinellae]SER48009.1 hypothetical protein SAMN05421798_1118 [Pseudovibrio axinellae]